MQEKKHLFFHTKEKMPHAYNPDINTLFNSFVPLSHETEILALILTGIGEDGVSACVALSSQGVRCLTETSQSAIIDGMPMRARELVQNIEAHSIEEIVKIVREFCE